MRAGLFPGQGVAARAVLDSLVASDTLMSANEILGCDLRSKVMQATRRPTAVLPTSVAQPAIFTASVISYRERELDFDCFAGHSLGEYAALVAAGSLTFEDALCVVKVRAEATHRSVVARPGGMAAVLGLDLAAAEAIAAAADVTVANDNAPGQVVFAGDDSLLAQAASLVKAAGGRSVRLDVAGAFHSAAVAAAAPALASTLDGVAITRPRMPVLSNVTAQPYGSPAEIRSLLVQQLTERVRFRESLLWLHEQGVEEFVDLGPGRVVGALAERAVAARQERVHA